MLTEPRYTEGNTCIQIILNSVVLENGTDSPVKFSKLNGDRHLKSACCFSADTHPVPMFSRHEGAVVDQKVVVVTLSSQPYRIGIIYIKFKQQGGLIKRSEERRVGKE